jgi:periplasmic copper chaperone A
MRPPIARSLLAVGILAAIAPAALAQQSNAGVTVSDAWARATASTASTGAAYLTITDHGTPDRLVSASTPVAATAELHQTTMHDGVMQMRPVDGLPVSAGAPVTLAPGGYHLMLMQLRQPLHAGDSFPLTLNFAKAGAVQVNVAVKSAGAMSTGGMNMGHDTGSMQAGH